MNSENLPFFNNSELLFHFNCISFNCCLISNEHAHRKIFSLSSDFTSNFHFLNLFKLHMLGRSKDTSSNCYSYCANEHKRNPNRMWAMAIPGFPLSDSSINVVHSAANQVQHHSMAERFFNYANTLQSKLNICFHWGEKLLNVPKLHTRNENQTEWSSTEHE